MVANLVMEDVVEKRAVDSFRQPPRVWKRFVDDTFVIFDKIAVDKFFTHLNQIHNGRRKGQLYFFLDISNTRHHTGTLDTNI